jgi:hypothetical protein
VDSRLAPELDVQRQGAVFPQRSGAGLEIEVDGGELGRRAGVVELRQGPLQGERLRAETLEPQVDALEVEPRPAQVACLQSDAPDLLMILVAGVADPNRPAIQR